MERTIVVLVENSVGVLARVSGLFSARGFNIKSLSVGETEDPEVSVMTIVVDEDERTAEQVRKQLAKLVETVKVKDITESPRVERELALLRIAIPKERRGEVIEIVDVFKAKVVDVAHNSLVVEITGASEKVEGFIELMKSYGIIEMARTGKVALERGLYLEKKEKK
ncbi:MAG: acetolactate synthase small subunit [Spirochaetia bacterium]|nr:acetolactate synthase small subunit [Spirochaetota bacterium]MCX8097044.1 acetolactate synthase small subunit [Spirochaetota bacterium]MDW8111761.1 acetolactate synthase small subunit [Spirochaetia bacterium]